MFKHFVPAEFYRFHRGSWLQQFEHAISCIEDNNFSEALKYLIDTDYERWKSICDNIDNIDRVAKAIEFLGEYAGTQRRCCQPQYHRIENVIQIAKLAAWKKRNAKLQYEINAEQCNRQMLLKNLELLYTKIELWRSEEVKLMNSLATLDKKQRSHLAELQRQISATFSLSMEVERKIGKLQAKINIFQKCLIAIQPNQPGRS